MVSDMCWQQKFTAFYNLTTHHMDKIMETPETETAQMHECEQCKLKIQMVINL